MGDDNVIKFRKRPEPPKPPKPKKPQKSGGSTRVPPFVVLFFAAAAIGAVLFVLDQQKPAANPVSEAAP